MKLHETYLTEQEHQNINRLLAALDPKSPYTANINLYFDSVQVVMLLYEGKVEILPVISDQPTSDEVRPQPVEEHPDGGTEVYRLDLHPDGITVVPFSYLLLN